MNLYGFVTNDGVGLWDLLGQTNNGCPEGECCISGQCARCPELADKVNCHDCGRYSTSDNNEGWEIAGGNRVVMAGASDLMRWEKIGLAGIGGAFTFGLAINQAVVCLRACDELEGPGDEIFIKTRLNRLQDGVLGPLVEPRAFYTRVFIDENGNCDYEYVVGTPAVEGGAA